MPAIFQASCRVLKIRWVRTLSWPLRVHSLENGEAEVYGSSRTAPRWPERREPGHRRQMKVIRKGDGLDKGGQPSQVINICKDTESAWPILLFSKARVLSAGEGQEMQRGLYTKKKIKQAAMWSNLFLKESISVGVAPRGSGFPAKGKFLMDLIGLKEDEDERLG